MDISGRILGFNQRTGLRTPLVEGSKIATTFPRLPPWSALRIEHFATGPCEMPDLEIAEHLIILKCDKTNNQSQWRIDGKTRQHDFVQNEMVFAPPGNTGTWSSVDPHEALVLAFDQKIFVDLALSAGIDRRVEFRHLAPVTDNLIEACVHALYREAESGCPNGTIYGDSIGGTIALHLLSRFALPQVAVTGQLPLRTMRVVTDYINTNLQDDIKLTELAALAHMSPYHFCRSFKQTSGITPHQYLLRCRINYAIKLIAAGGLNLKEIAAKAGFYDQSHLNRSFKKLLNATPLDFARR